MSATREYGHQFFTQKLSSGVYLFLYNYGDNNVVCLIHPTPDIADTLEYYIPDEYVVNTMGDNMLE